MSDDTYIPRPIPMWFLLAAFAPTLILGVMEISRELGGPTLHLGWETFALAWLLTTIPLVLLAFGVKAIFQAAQNEGATKELGKALEALQRADKLAQAQMATLAKVDEVLARQPSASGGAPAPAKPVVGLNSLLVLGTVIFLVAAGGLAFAFLEGPLPPEPIHIHATFALFVEGERVGFVDPAFDLSQRGILASHLHLPDQDLLHIEGPPGARLASLLAGAVHTNLTAGRLQLDGIVHEGRVLMANATHPLRLFVAHDGSDNWTEVDGYVDYVPRDFDRMLLTYGLLTEEELARQQAEVARPPAEVPDMMANPATLKRE